MTGNGTNTGLESERAPALSVSIRPEVLASILEAGKAGHWDGAFAAGRVDPAQLEALAAYFEYAAAAVREAIGRREVAAAERFRAELRAQGRVARRAQPANSGSRALEDFLQGF